ncbi:hypothetical protein EDC04DRAFT_2605144 [Pisolithus marmoratus]|nr:hypothetical protein EDC04DRAFT_2605144 [Pisolithus marmoratus]
MAESSYKTSNQSSKEQSDPPPAGAKGATLIMFKTGLQLSPNKNLKKHHWDAKKKQKERIHGVLEHSGYKPGTSTWISKYQWAVEKVMKSMSAEELDQAKETADTWNNTRAPAECRAAEAKGRQYAKQCVEEMWKQCANMQSHNYNDEIGDGKLFDNWGRMQDWWAQYAQDAFRQEADDPQNTDGESPPVPKVCKGQKQPEVELTMSMYGTPEIPSILNMTIQEKMDVGKHLGSQRQLFHGVCHELTTLLEWWWDRQVCKPWDVFQFKMWVQSDGSTHRPVASKDVGSNKAGSLQQPMQKNTKGNGKANDWHDHDEWEDIDIDMLSDCTDTDDLVDDGWISSDTTGSHSNGEGPSTQPRTCSKSRLDSQRDGDSTMGKSLGKTMDRMDSNLGNAYKSLKIGPPKGQKPLPNTKSLRIEYKAVDTQIGGAKSRPKDKTNSGSGYSKHMTAPMAHSVVEGGKFLNFETTDLSGTQHPHEKETPVSNDGTKSTRAIKPNFWGKDTSVADVVGVWQSGCSSTANLNLSLISTYIALCSTNKHHSHIPSTNLSAYLPLAGAKLTSYCLCGHHYTVFFGDVPGLGPLGSLVQDPALVYPPLWTSQTLIHAQMRAIVPCPETWLYPEVTNLSIQLVWILVVVMPDCRGVWWSPAIQREIEIWGALRPEHILKFDGLVVWKAGHGLVAPNSTMSVTCSPDRDMVALVGGGGGDHPMGSNVPEYN